MQKKLKRQLQKKQILPRKAAVKVKKAEIETEVKVAKAKEVLIKKLMKLKKMLVAVNIIT